MKEEEEKLVSIFEYLKEAKEPLMEAQKEQPLVYLEDVKNRFSQTHWQRRKQGFCPREDLHHDQQVLDTLGKYVMDLKKENVQDGQSAFSLLRGWFNAEKEEYDNGFDKAAKQLEYAFDFMESAFAGGQELVVFITELNTSSPAVAFLQEYSCERYYRYNKELLFRGKHQRYSGTDPAAWVRRLNEKKTMEIYFYSSVCSGNFPGSSYVYQQQYEPDDLFVKVGEGILDNAPEIFSGEPKEVQELRKQEVADTDTQGLRQEYYFSQLNEEEQRGYREIIEGIRAKEKEFYLTIYEDDTVNKVYHAVLMDHPELFWVHNRKQVYKTTFSNANYCMFSPGYSYTDEEIQEIQAAADNAVKEECIGLRGGG